MGVDRGLLARLAWVGRGAWERVVLGVEYEYEYENENECENDYGGHARAAGDADG
jgi:hypothetical protein